LEYTINSPECEISKAVISGYIQELLQKYTPLSAKRKIASIRAFLNYLEFEELLDANPMKKIKTKFQEPKRLPRTIPLNFIEQILVVAHKEQEMATTQHGMLGHSSIQTTQIYTQVTSEK